MSYGLPFSHLKYISAINYITNEDENNFCKKYLLRIFPWKHYWMGLSNSNYNNSLKGETMIFWLTSGNHRVDHGFADAQHFDNFKEITKQYIYWLARKTYNRRKYLTGIPLSNEYCNRWYIMTWTIVLTNFEKLLPDSTVDQGKLQLEVICFWK